MAAAASGNSSSRVCRGDCLYKYEIRNRQHGSILLKTDPYGQRFELRPSTASIVVRTG